MAREGFHAKTIEALLADVKSMENLLIQENHFVESIDAVAGSEIYLKTTGQESEKIRAQNAALYQRLQKAKSSYSREKQLADFKKHEELVHGIKLSSLKPKQSKGTYAGLGHKPMGQYISMDDPWKESFRSYLNVQTRLKERGKLLNNSNATEYGKTQIPVLFPPPLLRHSKSTSAFVTQAQQRLPVGIMEKLLPVPAHQPYQFMPTSSIRKTDEPMKPSLKTPVLIVPARICRSFFDALEHRKHGKDLAARPPQEAGDGKLFLKNPNSSRNQLKNRMQNSTLKK